MDTKLLQSTGSRTFAIWTPEDKVFWEKQGEAIARVNLWISIPSLFLSFAIWQVWSVVAISLPALGFAYTGDQLFWLAALPSLSGATLRIFYSFVIPLVGGRRWTAISTASLLLPAIGIGFAIQNPQTPYSTMLILALLCGLGGGNFSSSMANISYFFPKNRKGSALGLNAGFGNLGVSVVQFLSPIVVSVGVLGIFGGPPQEIVRDGQIAQVWMQNATFIWVPWIVLVTIIAWFAMNDLAQANASIKDQAAIFKEPHTWLTCILYLGTFGSFIGFAAGFALLTVKLFPDINPLAYAWVGPLIGALSRPFGGWLADRMGGGKVTLWNFLFMSVAVIGVLFFLPERSGMVFGLGTTTGSFMGFFLTFQLLFFASGLGSGSTFRMIPLIFSTLAQRGVSAESPAQEREACERRGNMLGAAAVGFAGAFGAYGGFFIPKSYGSSIEITGGPETALWIFAFYYLSCAALTWWYYARRNASMPC
ncbi:MAG: MFS transporter [Gammaproteobacteria bacterium]|uniref:MFS transporter n=1 Tax=Limnobacter sp. TaxID=2003368 RepID=UPI001D54C1C2|nr:MFS transporter [Limnobacter sp.]MBU0783398.1 MFS transporter [Gammaproteobacteria bacterium]MBU0850617.1 MFS transporter [Gammaproteobacteria bacterium]MBU1267792.1 MFS transporter [Gammaproteobacteria bacterium]MBU1529649.1 MFS transporter [Gammaproteobacteria bacterium]MBU1780629.1 MFS transporter [Gammaproteobacteria bacterium]